MNDRERFLAVASGQTADYIPIFAFPGAPGMSRGAQEKTHARLVATGMPAHVGGRYGKGHICHDPEGWYKYWGTTGPIGLDFAIAGGAQGFKYTSRIEGEYEIVESESGAITRQVLDNDITYSMPDFVRFAVRDRASWELYRERCTPRKFKSAEEIEAHCRRFDGRTMPLCIGMSGAYALVRGLMGPEAASLAFYDDPQLVHDMIQWEQERVRREVFPLIERLRPEIVATGEDLCYNHGMLLSPAHFHEFCGAYYREVCDFARSCAVPVITVDTDGNAMEFTDIIAKYGVNSIHPYEVKGGNDLFALRRRHPEFILFGWLEKEIINEGNERMIAPEILAKVPPLLAQRRYFPNGDHGIQPPVTFENLCKFHTLLHEVCNNPEGEFPRIRPD